MVDRNNDLMVAQLPDASSFEYPSFPIVGVGASAGGLEAFTQLLAHLPTTTGMAYIFVQHLAPSHSSILPDLLARVTKMPLRVAQDQMTVEPDHVYVIPPNADLTLERGIIQLLPRTQQGGQHLTIDRFFRSLAQDRTRQVIGVLLSGTAFDGTNGLEAIKARGGITFAQSIQSAEYSQMPQHAIAAGWVDQVLSPYEIASALITLKDRKIINNIIPLEIKELTLTEQQAFTRIRQVLSRATNVDFLAYRPATLQRRILRRMGMIQIDQMPIYATYLDEHPAEVEALSQEVLIHVTNFFRDPSTFEAVTRLVFPELVHYLLPGDPIRLWVAGCSTGEEVYSLAICLLEFQEERGLQIPFQIFATDIDATALKQARAGVYLTKNMQEVSAQRLQRFFVPMDRNGEQYQISKAIRECCVFARQNVAKDPPFSHLGLVSCRNVLMYLTPVLQEKVLQTLHYALKPHGFLLLGTSESVGPDSTLFTREEPYQKLFTKKSWARSLPLGQIAPADEPIIKTRTESVPEGAEDMIHTFDVHQEADRLLLTTYAPASVVIDTEMQILHVRGRTGPYLEPAPGKANLHLLKWTRDGLQLGLRTAIHEAQKEDHPIVREGLRVSGTTRSVRVTVVPLKGTSPTRYLLVLFEEEPPTASLVAKHAPFAYLPGRRGKRTDAAARIAALEQELATTQAEGQAMLEVHDRVSEHLQEANEETRSSNEELQSINEELETSQAELQAINEELTTANQELQTRNEQLRVAQDYAESIVETIREPLVVLSADMQVQHANTTFYQFFHVTPSETEHHLLYELGNRQWNHAQLRDLLQQAEAMNQPFHGIEVEHHFPTIGHKIMQLSGRRIVGEHKDTRGHLILLAMEDITARKELERQKETFLGMVSHELKTPLTAAKGFVQLLQRRMKKAGDEQTAAELGKIDERLNKLSYLIGSLLDANALETGTFSLHPALFDVDTMVREIVEECGPTSANRLHIQDTVHTKAYGDRERTGQVLLNLLTNALKYSAVTDPVWVRILLDENGITVSVQDHGVGIPHEQQAQIFERFARLDQAKQSKVPGVGLGLYIAAQIITHQGGRIWVESTPDKGTTFFFTLLFAPPS